jgi:predicted dehydrogenase
MSIGIGVVGSGFMGQTWAEVAARHVPGTHLVGVTGGRRARGLAADRACRLFDDVDAMAADPEVEIVVLASPPAVHREQTMAFAAAGKHLLVEKPMAQSVSECRDMVDACAAAGVKLSVVSQHRFRTVPMGAKRAIDEGRIGRVTMVRATGAAIGFWDTTVTGDQWKLDPAQQTAYASWGAHACDLIRWFVSDEPDLAFAVMADYSSDPPPDRSAMVTYRFAGGSMAQVWMSYDIPAPGLGSGLDLLIVGTTGMIEVDSYGRARLGIDDGWATIAEQEPLNPSDPRDPVRLQAYAGQLKDLLDAVRAGSDPLVDGRQGLFTTAMLDAAQQSAITGNAIRLNPVDGTLRGGVR